MSTPASAFVARPLWYDEVDSTMDEARTKAIAGAAAGTAVVATSQRRGRGQHGRSWASAKGQGIYLTLVLRPTALAALPSLSPAMALALTALGPRVGLAPLAVKWPNDLLGILGKVGGLLLEQASDAAGLPFVLVGLGLNLRTPTLPPEHAGHPPPLPPSSLAAEGASEAALADVPGLVAQVLELMGTGALAWQRQGFAGHTAAYDRAHAFFGRAVRAEGGGPRGEDVFGVVGGIEPDGALQLVGDGQTWLLRSATLRPSEPFGS